MRENTVKQKIFDFNSFWFLLAAFVGVLYKMIFGNGSLGGLVLSIPFYMFCTICNTRKKYTTMCFSFWGGFLLLVILLGFCISAITRETLLATCMTIGFIGLAVLSFAPHYPNAKWLLKFRYVPVVCIGFLPIHTAVQFFQIYGLRAFLFDYHGTIFLTVRILQDVFFALGFYQLGKKYCAVVEEKRAQMTDAVNETAPVQAESVAEE